MSPNVQKGESEGMMSIVRMPYGGRFAPWTLNGTLFLTQPYEVFCATALKGFYRLG